MERGVRVFFRYGRHGMILFGDLDFLTSDSVKNRQGRNTWTHFKSLLDAGGHVYRDGLPVVCEKHKTSADLSDPEAFHREAPDGGCRLKCGTTLDCKHVCPRRQVFCAYLYMKFDQLLALSPMSPVSRRFHLWVSNDSLSTNLPSGGFCEELPVHFVDAVVVLRVTAITFVHGNKGGKIGREGDSHRSTNVWYTAHALPWCWRASRMIAPTPPHLHSFVLEFAPKSDQC